MPTLVLLEAWNLITLNGYYREVVNLRPTRKGIS